MCPLPKGYPHICTGAELTSGWARPLEMSVHIPWCPCCQQGLREKEGPTLSSVAAGWEPTERKFSSVHSQCSGVGCLGPETLKVSPQKSSQNPSAPLPASVPISL